jgi:hypothetical protein
MRSTPIVVNDMPLTARVRRAARTAADVPPWQTVTGCPCAGPRIMLDAASAWRWGEVSGAAARRSHGG